MAGVKSEKEFYKLFPDEESFMKVHGKTFKKAKLGATMGGIEDYRFGQYSDPQQLGYSLSGNPDDQQFNADGQPIYGQTIQQSVAGQPTPGVPKEGIMGKLGGLPGIGNTAGKLIGGFQKLKGEKENLRKAQQMEQVSDVMVDASRTRPEEISRRYVRPEDMIIQPNQLNNPYGQGTVIKNGGKIPKAKNGFMDFMGSGGTDIASNLISQIGGENAGGDIGGEIGGTVGKIFGPVGSMVGKLGGQIIGGLLDRNPHKTKEAQEDTRQNMGMMAFNSAGQGMQKQYTSYMENGGTLNGDLQTGKGGYAEPISYNPYLPEDGQTVMFRGKDHAQGGIDVAYGGNPVEVESGEPGFKTADGDFAIMGNLPINKMYANVLGDPKAGGKKFKNYVADLSKQENRHNKTVDSSTRKAGELDLSTSFDKLSLNSYKANVIGSNMKLKDIAEKKNKASTLQEAINRTAEEYGIVADDFAKGNIKKAKTGITVGKEKKGITKDDILTGINSILPYFRPSDTEPLDPNQLMGEMYAMSNNQMEPVKAQTISPQLDNPYNIYLQDIRNENQADYRSSQRMMGGNPAAQAMLNAQKYMANQKVGADEFRINQAQQDKVYSGNRDLLNKTQAANLGIYDQQYTRQEQAKSNTKAVNQAALSSISDKVAKNMLENRTLQTYENLYNYRYDNQGRAINMNPLAQFNTGVVGNNANQSGIIKNSAGEDLLPIYGKDGDVTGYKVKQGPKSKSKNGSIIQAIKNL